MDFGAGENAPLNTLVEYDTRSILVEKDASMVGIIYGNQETVLAVPRKAQWVTNHHIKCTMALEDTLHIMRQMSISDYF